MSKHGILDLVLVAEEMGAAVAPGPLVPTNVVAHTIATYGNDAQKAAWLPGILAGEVIGAWVSGDGAIVEAGAQADVFVVSRPDGQRLVAATDASVTPLGGLDLVRRLRARRHSCGGGRADRRRRRTLLQVAVALQVAETCGVVAAHVRRHPRVHGRSVLVRPAALVATRHSSTA